MTVSGPKPNFYLTSAGESDCLASPRACWEMGRLTAPAGSEYMLVYIEPSLIGQPFGLGGRDIDTLIVSPHVAGHTLFPISNWPCHVYVFRILDDSIIKTKVFGAEQVEMIAWGQIFLTAEEAQSAADQSSR